MDSRYTCEISSLLSCTISAVKTFRLVERSLNLFLVFKIEGILVFIDLYRAWNKN